MTYTWADFDKDRGATSYPTTATHWDGKGFVPYPEIVVKVARATWIACNDCLDRHVRPTAWEDWQDPRMGAFAGAMAAAKICGAL